MTETLEGLMVRMVNFKEIVEQALLDCEECEIQNLVYTDAVLGFWIKDLREIIVGGKNNDKL